MRKWDLRKLRRGPWILYILFTVCFLISPSLSLRKLIYVGTSKLAPWAALAMAEVAYLLLMVILTFLWILFRKYGVAYILLTLFTINGLLMGLAGISDRFPTLYQLAGVFIPRPHCGEGGIVAYYQLFLTWLLAWVVFLIALYFTGRWFDNWVKKKEVP